MGKILPILLALLGLGIGGGVGLVLRPAPHEDAALAEGAPCGEIVDAHAADATAQGEGEDAAIEYVKLNNQFVIPVVTESRVEALVVLSLSLEMAAGNSEAVYQREPKLRDIFLQVLFDHANSGGFEGAFTSGHKMTLLRDALRSVAVKALGSAVKDVLIVDIVRQDT